MKDEAEIRLRRESSRTCAFMSPVQAQVFKFGAGVLAIAFGVTAARKAHGPAKTVLEGMAEAFQILKETP